MKLYVGNLPPLANEEELRNWFEKHHARPHSGQPRGFGFVEITDDEEAVRAMLILNRRDLLGHTLLVNEAHTRRAGGRR